MTERPDWEIVPMTLEMAAEGNVLESKCFAVPTSENLLRTELLKPEAIYFAAVSEGKLVGYVGMQSVLDEGYMMDLCVDPERRREGIARALMERLLEGAEKAELSFVTLEVRVSNEPAKALYASLGFEQVGVRRDYYTDPIENALLLTKYLRKEKEKDDDPPRN